MALFKPLRGSRENLPEERRDGYAYFCVNDGTFWIDHKDENGALQRTQVSVDAITNEQIDAICNAAIYAASEVSV